MRFVAVLVVIAFALASPPAHADAATDANVPNDPHYAEQWNLQAINWLDARGTGVSGAGVTVAVVDTGVTQFDDLAPLLPGHDVTNNVADASDPNGHGTHVASIIASLADNGVGMAGVAPSVSVLPVRAADTTGNATDANIIAGIAWAADHDADVINLSLQATAPHVAGVAALILEADPELSPTGVRDILTSTATDLGAPGGDDSYGAGLVDASAAVQVALRQATVPAQDTSTFCANVSSNPFIDN